ncbi:MAG: ribosome small subunit-dependent GTPase A [Candidatus Eisenbacteria bacterium]
MGRDEDAAPIHGVVIRVDPGRITVLLGEQTVSAAVRGALKQGARRAVHLVAVGDHVEVARERDAYRVLEVLPRRNRVSRIDPGDRSGRREQVLAANVDQLVVMVSPREPELNRRGVDRLLALGEISALPILLVLNKQDLLEPGEDPLAPYRRIGYPAVESSLRTGLGLDRLRSEFAGRVSLLCGPSGVGKSSLTNRLAPGSDLRVGEVSRATGKGTHTTTRVHWTPISAGGALLDSPGLRGIRPFGLTPLTLATTFREFSALDPCQFGDCRHRAEPGCAVRSASDSGAIDPDRYESYVRLLAALEDERTPPRRGSEGGS